MPELILYSYFAITYAVSFAILTSAVVTVLLWHSSDIIAAFNGSKSPPVRFPRFAAIARDGLRRAQDIHVQMMERSYEPVPGSWYAWIGFTMLGAAIFVVTFYPMQLPVWGLLLSLMIALFFLPACGIIAATTGTVIGRTLKA